MNRSARGRRDLVVFPPGGRHLFGECYLFGAQIPCLPGCYHCEAQRRHGLRVERMHLVPCPVCLHLPERILDPGPLPVLDEDRPRRCGFCHDPLPRLKRQWCSEQCEVEAREREEPGWISRAEPVHLPRVVRFSARDAASRN